MLGRYALIAASTTDEDARELADVLGDPERGGYTVEHTDDAEAIARFLGDRVRADVVLVHTDGIPIDLTRCRSTHVLLVSTAASAPDDVPQGRAMITGAPARAVMRALRAGRADRDADGDVTARELYDRLRPTLPVAMRSALDTEFVVARSRRPQEALRRHRRERAVSAWRLACVLAALVAALALPWFYGGTGFEFGFADGTAWPNRVAAVLCAALALLAGAYVVHRRGGHWLAVLAAITFGATAGLWERFVTPDVGPGIVVVFLALALLLSGLQPAIRQRADRLGLACVGGVVFTYQLVGPWTWAWLLAGAAALAGGAWSLLRR